ncbi:acyltransferase family protein [Cellulomonas fulva]|uniref:acyltransferase family protein n=1 Tax=Cellulomonas fulva TaxID=2835530 RepID=UPI0027DE02A5|nr:acyltransferase family protein [Cellulomonas fulva]
MRADIQGLRALAVASVVVFHFWPSVLPGGFTGVDVFFVVSGFLITGQILRDVDRFGAGAFAARFWAARARRILPAALLVVAVVLVASWAVMPVSRWPGVGAHALSSALSLENWRLAAEAVDYGAEGAASSPYQHYWSLSVEEQFYVVWPLLLLALTLLVRRSGGLARLGRRTVVGAVMGAVLVTSLAYSFVVTAHDPGAAYFVTPARIWQLAAGGLVALLAVRGVRGVPWAGVALIGVGFVLIDTDTPYPGLAALLPTVGACLVLVGGPTGRFSFDRLTSARPVQHLGDISYSVYLWHWPLLVLTPIALGRDLTTVDLVLLVAVTLAVSELSYRLVEQPFRRGRALRTPARACVAGAVSIALVATAAVQLEHRGDARIEAAAAELAQAGTRGAQDDCRGGAALDHDCADPFGPVAADVALAASSDLPVASSEPRCSDDTGPFSTVVCRYGDPKGRRTLLLWGNSHASAWSDAVAVAGKRLGWKVVVASRSGCPANLDLPSTTGGPREQSTAELEACAERNRWVLSTLVPKADVVLMSDLRAGWADGSRSIDGFVEAIEQSREAGAKVVWLGDVPLTDGVLTRVDGPQCLQLHGQCSNPVSKALVARVVTERVVERVPDLSVIDVTSRFCDDERCYSGIGGVSVYFDGLHLSGTYSHSLGPWLARELKAAVRRAG